MSHFAEEIIFQVVKIIRLIVLQECCSLVAINCYIVIFMHCIYSRLQHPENEKTDWLV